MKTTQQWMSAINAWICMMSLCVAGRANTDAPPKVIILAIGVSSYAGGQRLDGCDSDALRFVSRMSATFIDPEIHAFISGTNSLPTLSALRRFVTIDVPQVPPCSLIIVYFAGHGVQVGADRPCSTTDMGMVCEGGDPAAQPVDLDHVLLYSELLQGLKRTEMGNFLVFLDCCHSGPGPALTWISTAQELQLLSVRGLVFAACLRNQKTTSNIFSEALGDVWESISTGCLTPLELQKRVRGAVDKRLSSILGLEARPSLLTPSLVLGEQTQVCLGAFGKPSTFLFLRPPACASRATFEIDGGGPEEFWSGRDAVNQRAAFYIRQVARHELQVRCENSCGFDRQLTIPEAAVSREVLWVDFSKPEGMEFELPKDPVLLGQLSDQAFDLSARDSSAFDLELARAECAIGSDVAEQQQTPTHGTFERPYVDARWRLLGGVGTATDYSEVCASSDALRIAALLNSCKRPEESLALLDLVEKRDVYGRAAIEMHRYVSYTMLGDNVAVEEIAQRFGDFNPTSDETRVFLALTQQAKSPAMARTCIASLPVNLPEKGLRDALERVTQAFDGFQTADIAVSHDQAGLSNWREVGAPTVDRLDIDHALTILGGIHGPVTVSQGSSVLVEFPGPVAKYSWLDNGEPNSSACPAPFQAVLVSRHAGDDRRFDQRFFVRK